SDEFKKCNVKMIALPIDSVADHLVWSKDVMVFNSERGCSPLPFPIIIDMDGMPLIALCVFVVGPDKMKLSMYPATTGRNFDELLSVIDSAAHCTHIHVDWKINTHSHFDIEKAAELFPNGATTKELRDTCLKRLCTLSVMQ
uniref:Uncharacterized protein n=1 Tax=Salmo trutta TaxID=8032 RepID=A0A673W8T3_SALTR